MKIVITDSSGFLLIYNDPKEIMLAKESENTYVLTIETSCEENVKIILDGKTGKSLLETLEKLNMDTVVIKSVKGINF